MRKSKIVKILVKQHDFIEDPLIADEEERRMRSLLTRLADKFGVREGYNKAVAKRAAKLEEHYASLAGLYAAKADEPETPEKFNGVFDD